MTLFRTSSGVWSQVSATCSDGSPINAISISPDENVTCTLTYAKAGSLTVSVQAPSDPDPNDPSPFYFTAGPGLNPSSFAIYDSGNQLGNPSSKQYTIFQPGSYSVSELASSGWRVSSATCSDGSSPSNINISAGESVNCVFVNQLSATLLVFLDAQPNSGQDFAFTAGGGLSPTSFSLDDDGEDSNGLANARQFSDLAPGSGYSVSETVPAFWNLQSATCSDGSSPSNITLSEQEFVVCTFTNTQNYPGYARPKAATPIWAPLVPAYEPCASPNRQHAARCRLAPATRPSSAPAS